MMRKYLPAIGLVILLSGFFAITGFGLGCAVYKDLTPAKVALVHNWHKLPTPDQMDAKTISVLCGSQSLVPFMDQWVREAARRYDNFIMIFMHGEQLGRFAPPGSTEAAAWARRAAGIIKQARSRYGIDRRVVFVVCNPKGIKLDVPGVTYGLKSIWAVPDSFVSTEKGRTRDSPRNLIGDVFEMIENPLPETR